MKKGLLILLAAVMLLTAAPILAEESGLKMGDSGEKVLELNTRLRQLNYTTIRATEQYTEATRAAVSAVQEAYGLAVTGEADAATLAIIYGDCRRPLKFGDSGEDVKQLQEKLIEMGYYRGNVSGNYLEGSTAAIQVFQGEMGLEITGAADVKTLEMLFALSVRPTPSPTPVPAPTAQPTASPTPGPYQAFKRKLVYGSTGSDVQQVQQRLMDLGFFTFYKTTTGYYKNSQDAVSAFQKHNGLNATGEVDEDTWNMLFNDPSVAGAGDPAKPAYELPYFFEVDVKNQVVKVWKYDHETQDYTIFDRAFLCATGTTSNPTPLGTFTLSGRKSAHAKFPKWGGGEARWWTKINGDIAFHSVLYSSSSDDSTIKVSSLTGLGKRGSHGCIRLTVADAKWIYDHVAEGMQVWIHDDAAADPELRYAIQPGEYDRSIYGPKTTPAPTPFPEYDGLETPDGEMRNLSVGKAGEDVYWLQMKLKELGFYTGTVTGQYREGTQNAVKAYQRSRGLNADGNAGKQTLNQLYKEVAEAAAEAAEATSTPDPEAPADTPAPTEEPIFYPEG